MAEWRKMTLGDIEGVIAVADAVHPGLPERAEVMAERVALYPNGCRVLAGPDGKVLGYAISHPIVPGHPPALDSFLREIGPNAVHYYLHDVALLPQARGGGQAQAVITALLEEAEAFEAVALVSVYGTAPFWSRFGFVPVEADMAAKLAPYGEGAVYMIRPSKAACGMR